MIAQSVAEILSHHVKLTVEGIDRMYLNVYVPRLQCETGIVGFFRNHRGNPLPSSALMKPMPGVCCEAGEVCGAASDTAGTVPQGTAQRRCDETTPAPVPEGRRNSFCRQGPGKDPRIPHRAPAQSEDRPALSMDCAFHRDGKPLLHLCT